MVLRGVLGQEGESGDDASDIPEADLPCAANASVHMALEAHDVPTDDDGPGGESTHCNEAEASVLRREEVMDPEENGKPSDNEAQTEPDEWKSKARAIREVGHDEAEGKRRGGGWHRVKLCLDRRVAKRFHYCGGEIGESFRKQRQKLEWMLV
ncbi:MAG: hypothetical protein Q9182_004228 [Xanthomendoza sp. 2 TL-2023]